MLKKTLLPMMLMVMACSLAGCVSMGRFEQKEQESKSLDKRLQDLQQQYMDLNRENETLKAQVEKLTGRVAELSREKEQLVAERGELSSVLKLSKTESVTKVSELSQLITDLERDNSRLREEITVTQRSREESAQKTSKSYEELLEKMKMEISRGTVTISELQGKLTVDMKAAILFDSGSAEVKPAGLEVLQKVIDVLKDLQGKLVRIEGHTDNVLTSGALAAKYPTSWELSAARAINVARYLQMRGIDPSLLSAGAYGEYRPVASNDTPEGRARNGRIEIVLVNKD
jgi:chemotaxis protein MotB